MALSIQVFLAVATSCTLLGAAISSERRKVMEEQRGTIAQLKRTTERLELFVEASPVATIVVDMNAVVEVWNKAAEQTFGWCTAEVVGKPAPMIPLDAQAQGLRERLIAGQTLHNVELTRHRKDGRAIQVSMSASPYRDDAGHIGGAVLLYADITAFGDAQTRLKQERDFNAAILNTVGSLVIVLDIEGRIIMFNRACETCSGYTAQEAAGRRFLDFLVAPEQVEHTTRFLEMLKLERVNLDVAPLLHDNDWTTKDGRRRHIAWAATLMGAEGKTPTYIIGTGIDMTERLRAEGALRAVVEGTSGATGEAFFHNLVTQLARTLGVRSVMLCSRT